MTSVLYSAGLNYQSGNPVRQEIMSVRREVDSLRKQLEILTEENLVYRKHLMKLSQKSEEGATELTKDLMELSSSSTTTNRREAGGGTVQGGGFRR
jgi:regulator of replication initiation timing